MNYILHGVFDSWLRYVTNDGIWFDELGINKVAICLFAHHKSHENHSARVLQMDFSHCILLYRQLMNHKQQLLLVRRLAKALLQFNPFSHCSTRPSSIMTSKESDIRTTPTAAAQQNAMQHAQDTILPEAQRQMMQSRLCNKSSPNGYTLSRQSNHEHLETRNFSCLHSAWPSPYTSHSSARLSHTGALFAPQSVAASFGARSDFHAKYARATARF
jgi:hypothetical protein